MASRRVRHKEGTQEIWRSLIKKRYETLLQLFRKGSYYTGSANLNRQQISK